MLQFCDVSSEPKIVCNLSLELAKKSESAFILLEVNETMHANNFSMQFPRTSQRNIPSRNGAAREHELKKEFPIPSP